MNNFESNELKPDSSDRPNVRRKNGPNAPKVSNPFANIRISRQHMMIGIGALILLVIILTIVSSLKSTGDAPAPAGTIDLTPNAGTQPLANQQIEPQEITISPVSPTPTEAEVRPADPNQHRVEIPGSVVDSLSQQPAEQTGAPANTAAPAPTQTQPPARTTAPAAANVPASLASLPAGHVTLQLSGASRPDSLEAFAKKQNLGNYWVYETRREGKPWFVLIYGSYPNVQEANKAIATLPADVQAKKPWVKPIRQVHQESKQR